MKSIKKKNIIVISPAGGHFREALIALENIDKKNIVFVTNPLPHLNSLIEYDIKYIVDPHNSIIKYILNWLQSVIIYINYRPNIILSTGGGLSLFLFIVGNIFGSKTIFIESGSRILYPSRTGRLLYYFSDYFIIQSKKLKKYYPNSVLVEMFNDSSFIRY